MININKETFKYFYNFTDNWHGGRQYSNTTKTNYNSNYDTNHSHTNNGWFFVALTEDEITTLKTSTLTSVSLPIGTFYSGNYLLTPTTRTEPNGDLVLVFNKASVTDVNEGWGTNSSYARNGEVSVQDAFIPSTVPGKERITHLAYFESLYTSGALLRNNGSTYSNNGVNPKKWMLIDVGEFDSNAQIKISKTDLVAGDTIKIGDNDNAIEFKINSTGVTVSPYDT